MGDPITSAAIGYATADDNHKTAGAIGGVVGGAVGGVGPSGALGAYEGGAVGSGIASVVDQFAHPNSGGGPSGPGLQNPGTTDLSQTNPELWAEILKMRSERDKFHDQMQYLFDPNLYNARIAESQQRAGTGTMNRFASIGLAGSSAAIGTAAEQDRQIEQGFRDRQMGEQLRALQMESALSGQIRGALFQGQGQYAGYQKDLYNAELARQAREASLWGSILGAAGTVGGAALGGYFGGPMGAHAGAAGGAQLGAAVPGQNPAFLPTNDPYGYGGY